MSESRKGSEGHLTENGVKNLSFLQLVKTFLIMGLTAYGPVILDGVFSDFFNYQVGSFFLG